ncbi:unnamed protein product [Sympodiomycopsis kandeliae]
MTSLFVSATKRSASSVPASCVASSSAAPLSATAPSSSCSAQRLFSTSSVAQGKSRPGEGKDARRAIRRAARQGHQSESASGSEVYTLSDAFRVLKANQITRPLSAIEIHIVTSVPRNQSNALRGRISFPFSPSTKQPTIVVIASEGTAAHEAASEAKSKGQPIILGGLELIDQIANNQVSNFDKLIATPEVMGPLSKQLARSLGPKGLMPNVKRGTVAESASEMSTAIDEALGANDWRGDKQSVIRAAIGRMTFEETQLRHNLRTILASIVERVSSGLGGGQSTARGPTPTAVKLAPRPDDIPAPPDAQKKAGSIIKQLHLSSTQGPGILLDLKECL